MDGQQVASWAAIRALLSGRLLASKWIRPIGIGETWRRAIAKCILHVAGSEAEACGIDQLCAVRIRDRRRHSRYAACLETNKAEEGFLLMTLRMRSTNRIELPCCGQFDTIASGARFTFNCYKHWSTLVIRATTMGSFLYRGVAGTRFQCLLMVSDYYHSFVLKVQFPEMDQTWYADDAGERQVRCNQASF
jgi:hypothetical protein